MQVRPERLAEYIRRLDGMVRSHGTQAAYYAHASVGCLHIRPIIDLKQAPDLEMPDTSGTSHDLYDVKAQYTMLLFWASTCSHCRDEMPSISDFYKEFHKKYDMEIFGVSTDTSITRWKSFIRRKKLPWINVFGRKSFKGSYHQLYDIRSTPVIYLLDERKIIIAKYLTPARAGEIILQREAVKNRKQATIKNN